MLIKLFEFKVHKRTIINHLDSNQANKDDFFRWLEVCLQLRCQQLNLSLT
jgi:hypothetical protein